VVMESLPVMSHFALFFFGIALTIYLWDLHFSVPGVVLIITSFGFGFYMCITVAAVCWKDCPFQTPLSVLLSMVLPWVKQKVVKCAFEIFMGWNN